jgi:hypothetical protein
MFLDRHDFCRQATDTEKLNIKPLPDARRESISHTEDIAYVTR